MEYQENNRTLGKVPEKFWDISRATRRDFDWNLISQRTLGGGTMGGNLGMSNVIGIMTFFYDHLGMATNIFSHKIRSVKSY